MAAQGGRRGTRRSSRRRRCPAAAG
ncbi:unnamed protein product [Spirodela intermedia]|uniref:Uncharacterized protein n=2 Tax=Spirodela intermedia TaxID=51605 RepID=A0A7I8IZV6_SPIIN|nr:unnamed protein product [Spirodela intermedia]CAA6663417.1 unnamed protein product [Spirodela intermedia]CAA7399882.1 unnamed protein product [Spirodela intermedia]